MLEKSFRFYVSTIRPYTSRILWKFYLKRQPIDSTRWKDVRDLDIDKFSEVINKYEYLPEYLEGALDYSFPSDYPNYFFSSLKKGRDCGSWARIWKIWGLYHGYSVQEVVVTNKKKIIRDSHVVTVLYKNNEFIMCDYRPYRGYETLEDSVMGIADHWTKYTRDNLIYELYEEL